MTRQALIDLLEKVQAGEWSVTHWRDFIALNVDEMDEEAILAHRALYGSLDAAKALHEALLPGWDWSVHGNGQCYLWPPGDIDTQNRGCIETEADIPARAWLIAILSALIQQQEGEG